MKNKYLVGRSILVKTISMRMDLEEAEVRSKLETVPEKHVKLIVENYVLETDAEDLANELGVTPAAIGGKVSAALRVLKKSGLVFGAYTRKCRRRSPLVELGVFNVNEAKVYTAAQVANMFRCSERTVRRHCSEGLLKGVKSEAGWTISSDSLKEFLCAR